MSMKTVNMDDKEQSAVTSDDVVLEVEDLVVQYTLKKVSG